MYISPINLIYEKPKVIDFNIDDKIVCQIVQECNIDINKKELIQALHADRERYEEAYRRGWRDCQAQYEEEHSEDDLR